MLLLDVNVVLAAQRADHPRHRAVRAWFDTMLNGGERFTVPTLVWASFLRLTTNRRIFEVCEEADASGDLIPDAVIAAVAAEHACRVASLDHDFARFRSIEHVWPELPV